jgi:hypothetical protein
MTVGECRLCLRTAVLLRSHIIPAGVYRRFYSDKASNPNPILITSKKLVQTSRQTVMHMLCANCEALLNERGEKWVLPLLANQDKSFPLLELLEKIVPDAYDGAGAAVYAASRNSEFKTDMLCHFALGIFWKSSVYCPPRRPSKSQIDLGRHSDVLRCLLQGPTVQPLPDGLALLIVLLPPPRISNLTHLPIEGGEGLGYRSFNLYVPGVQFTLLIGKGFERLTCFASNPLHPICVADISELVERDAKRLYFEIKARKKYNLT